MIEKGTSSQKRTWKSWSLVGLGVLAILYVVSYGPFMFVWSYLLHSKNSFANSLTTPLGYLHYPYRPHHWLMIKSESYYRYIMWCQHFVRPEDAIYQHDEWVRIMEAFDRREENRRLMEDNR